MPLRSLFCTKFRHSRGSNANSYSGADFDDPDYGVKEEDKDEQKVQGTLSFEGTVLTRPAAGRKRKYSA